MDSGLLTEALLRSPSLLSLEDAPLNDWIQEGYLAQPCEVWGFVRFLHGRPRSVCASQAHEVGGIVHKLESMTPTLPGLSMVTDATTLQLRWGDLHTVLMTYAPSYRGGVYDHTLQEACASLQAKLDVMTDQLRTIQTEFNQLQRRILTGKRKREEKVSRQAGARSSDEPPQEVDARQETGPVVPPWREVPAPAPPAVVIDIGDDDDEELANARTFKIRAGERARREYPFSYFKDSEDVSDLHFEYGRVAKRGYGTF